MDEEYTINETHNLFLNKLIDNEQTKSVHLMKLDSHRTLYRDGAECKYLTNLVIAGRNFLSLYAIFQNETTLGMGTHHFFEDIRLVKQWQKNIVVQAGNNKIVGIIYEDCILKNSFMMSLEFLDLGPQENINIICDKLGYYMLIVTSRELLLCISQKTIQKYKAKPFYHRNSVIVTESIKWNRQQYQSIADVIRLQLYDFDISKVECFNFCDDKLYFIGHSSKNSTDKSLFYVTCATIFSDDENQPLLMCLTPHPSTVKEIYPIHRGKQSQYLIVRNDGSIELQSQKGIINIEKSKYQNQLDSYSNLIRSNQQSIFPFYVLQDNLLNIYRRDNGGYNEAQSSITLVSQIYKSQLRLPKDIYIKAFDVRQYFFVYCNDFQVGIINFQGFEHQKGINQKTKEFSDFPERNIVKQSFGGIIDFSIGRNLLIIENYHESLCRVNILAKAIKEDPRLFVTHPQKNCLESLPRFKYIRSLSSYLDVLIDRQSVDRQVYERINELMIINHNGDKGRCLYRVTKTGKFSKVLSQFEYFTVVPENFIGFSQSKQWVLVVWYKNSEILSYYSIGSEKSLVLIRQVNQIRFDWNKNKNKIINVGPLLIQPEVETPFINFYDMRHDRKFSIKLAEDSIDMVSAVSILKKNITFKKKDKDLLVLEAMAITQNNWLYIWDIYVTNQQAKLVHKTEDIGEGLPILFFNPFTTKEYQPFQTNLVSHRFRAITCPQYALPTQNTNALHFECPSILKFQVYEYEGQSFLIMINQKNSLMVYKKYFCSPTVTNLQNTGTGHNFTTNSIIHSQVGFLYHREFIQPNILKRWVYNESNTFIDLGEGILKICNYAFFKGQLFEMSEQIISCFKMDDEIWGLQSNGKIKMLITKGKIISNYLVNQINTSINTQIIGLQSTNQHYVIYSPRGFEVFNKELELVWRLSGSQLDTKERIITLCAFDHYIAVSYFNYAVSEEDKTEYQSIRFKFRVYNIILKSKILEKDKAFEEPPLFIKYIPTDKLLLVTPSNVFVYQIKNDRTLQSFRRKNYSKRNMVSSFAYIPEKIGISPGYMLFGGNYGGLSFLCGPWIDKEKIDEIWFESIKCGIREIQIFHYGKEMDFLKALIGDDEGNLVVINLAANKAEKLADIHLGSLVTKIKKINETPYIASKDGCLHTLLPRKLKSVEVNFLDFQKELCEEIPFLGGLNTRQSRCLQQCHRTYKITSMGNIVDYEIFKEFMHLSETLQNHIFEKTDMDMHTIKNELFHDI